jgi:hypothetical protein
MNKKLLVGVSLATLLFVFGYYVISSVKKMDRNFDDIFAFSESDDYWFV